mmetsp:Transcript_5343/g.8214  ORF Transcript_5343/g.8214 Transcript_5343/m.8214 type:complete len:108 (+) Transcript_5343:492-815(+)
MITGPYQMRNVVEKVNGMLIRGVEHHAITTVTVAILIGWVKDVGLRKKLIVAASLIPVRPVPIYVPERDADSMLLKRGNCVAASVLPTTTVLAVNNAKMSTRTTVTA